MGNVNLSVYILLCLIGAAFLQLPLSKNSLLIIYYYYFLFLRKIVAEYEKTIAQMIGKEIFFLGYQPYDP